MKFLTPALTLAAVAVAMASPEAPRFETDVLPVFTQYCFTCHGQSSAKLGLDLRTAASAMKGSHNGAVITPGKPEESLLWSKMSSRAMPPAIYGQKVPDADLELVKRWISAGAPSDQASSVAARKAGGQHERFTRELLPIFQARCVQCHGEKSPMAGLDLRSVASVLRGSTHGPVVVEGFSERSLLVRRMVNKTMPPPGSGKAVDEAELRVIREWIDRGNFAESVDNSSADRPFTPMEAPPVTEEQRRFWSFRKPVAAPAPKVRAAGRVRTPIDSFALAKLEEKGLTLAPDASAEKLARRAYLDLTGLPPTPEQLRDFDADRSPGAYERLIDRLLMLPEYGERWARPWLDAAGYVDTTGKDFDPTKTEFAEGMWRYRDYVIRSINAGKPWSRFLIEQIAGDELVDWRSSQKFTPETVELLAATGYMRNILDITEEDISNLPVERYEALFKLVEKVSSSTLGLTVGCARCHSHKFDPIPQRDYYRFLSLFTTSYNPTDWVQPQNRYLWTVSKAEKEVIDAYNKQFDAPEAELTKSLKALKEPYEKRLFEEKLKTLPETIRDDTRAAFDRPADKRDDVQKYLVRKFGPALKIGDAEMRQAMNAADLAALDKLDGELKSLQGKRQKLEKIQALWDVGKAPSIRLLQRGSPESPGPRVEPGFPEVLSGAQGGGVLAKSGEAKGATSGTRLAFAEWLTSPENPLAARVIVNRIWQGHFGVGLVATGDNFGKMGAPPANQALLDWLAVDFMNHGWSEKYLHKLIMSSSVYRQSSRQPEAIAAKARVTDPDNALLWHMPLRRLDAEMLRDSIMSVAGKLDRTAGGPPIKLEMRPDGLQVVSSKEPPEARWRRSIYLTSRRTYPASFLGVFDYPIIDTHCARRVPSATPLQSLTLMNDDFVWEAARHMAQRAASIAGSGAAATDKIEAAYLLAYARRPSAREVQMAEAYLTAQQARLSDAAKAFAGLTQMLLSSNEFLYID